MNVEAQIYWRPLDDRDCLCHRYCHGNSTRHDEGDGTPRRGQHAKMNGCVNATFKIRPDIPDASENGSSAWHRILRRSFVSRTAPRVMTKARHPWDGNQAFTGPGNKVLDVEADATEQDFILADNPVFFIRNASDYVLFMQDFATSEAQGKPPEKFFTYLKEHHPDDIPVLLRYRQHIQNDPLTSTYWSQVPYAFGSDMRAICRYRCSPVTGAVVPAMPGSSHDYLRERMIERLAAGQDEVAFDFAVQVKMDASKSVIDNPTVEWGEPFEIGRHDSYRRPGVRHRCAEPLRRSPIVFTLACATGAPAGRRNKRNPQGGVSGQPEPAPRISTVGMRKSAADLDVINRSDFTTVRDLNSQLSEWAWAGAQAAPGIIGEWSCVIGAATVSQIAPRLIFSLISLAYGVALWRSRHCGGWLTN